MKKLTITFIRKSIAKAGYTLLSTEYKDARTKLKLKCDKGHVYEACWSSFKTGTRCPVCAGLQKLDIAFIKSRTAQLAHNYECLSNSYKNANAKLKLKCDRGHVYKASWHSFNSGARCPICAGNRPLTIQEIKKAILKLEPNYQVLSNAYTNNTTKLKLKCDKGHEYETCWTVFQRGVRCPICSRKKGSVKRRATIEFIQDTVQKSADGYKCLSTEYTNNKIKLQFKCNKGHIYKASWSDFKKGTRCPICAGKNKTITDIHMKMIEIAPGYQCLSNKYTNSNTEMRFRCPNNHIYETSWGNFCFGESRCPLCSTNAIRNITYVREMVPKMANGYKCLSTKYENYRSKLKFECDKGHIYLTDWTYFQRGARCPICAIENRRIHSNESLQNINRYRSVVTTYSNENYHKYFYDINPENLPRSFTEYHLDHIYTVIDGFNNGILPQIIANPTNLQMLPAAENQSKNGRSDMTKEELLQKYNNFQNLVKMEVVPNGV